MSDQNATVSFAEQELLRYWSAITGECSCSVRLTLYPPERQTLEQDAYTIDITQGSGSIAASSPRALLQAVYRFVRALGVGFVFPTAEGELIPKRTADSCTVQLEEAASYRHRGICIEGATSLEHVLNIIDYAAKIGFNAYYIQFHIPHYFFENWYSHRGNPHMQPEPITIEQSIAFKEQIEREIIKRGLEYHAIGHGWTCEALGIRAMGWQNVERYDIPEGCEQYLALINGKREFFGNAPLNTNLCYSSEKVQSMFVDGVVNYILTHPEVDIYHIWLADCFNNFCECENCRKHRVSDLYVEMLNKIDAKLTAKGNSAKLTVLIYLELDWAPVENRLYNKDRFILEFAPFHRPFTESYLSHIEQAKAQLGEPMPFVRNQLSFPRDIDTYLRFLFEWKKQFDGDSFSYDYQLMWGMVLDNSQLEISRVIYEDMLALEQMGLNGTVSCQMQRVFFPNGLPLYIMGQTLFDKSRTYEDIETEYLSAAYGKHSAFIKEYLTRIAACFSVRFASGDPIDNLTSIANGYRDGVAYLIKIRPKLEEMAATCHNAVHAKLFELLLVHNSWMTDYGRLMEQKALGATWEELEEDFDILSEKILSAEPKYHPFVDVPNYIATLSSPLKSKQISVVPET